MLRKVSMRSSAIGAACYRTEMSESPKSAGASAGKSARKKGTAGGTARSSAVSLLFQRRGSQHPSPNVKTSATSKRKFG